MRSRFMAVSGLISSVLAVTASAAFGQDQPIHPEPGTESPAVQRISIAYYTQKYSVSAEEASRRLELQDKLAPSLAAVEEMLGDRFGGAWFDANDGGQLKIAVVDRASERSRAVLSDVRAQLASKEPGRDTFEFVDATYSYADLVAQNEEAAKAIAAETAGSADGATTAVDVRRNALVVTRAAQAPGATARRGLERARDVTAAPVFEDLVDSKPLQPQTRCSQQTNPLSPFCDRPLRGGVEIQDYYGTVCSAAFNARSRSDGERYLMTAAHCGFDNGVPFMSKTHVHNQWERIGWEHNMHFYYSGRDAGIIRVNPNEFWNRSPYPGPYVWVDDVPPYIPHNGFYYIGNEAGPTVGTVVCATGGGGRFTYTPGGVSVRTRFFEGWPQASYTWCGTITYPSESVMFWGDPAQLVHNLVRTDLCFHGGMSGGAVYNAYMAYGIITGDACDSGWQVGWYYPAILAENALNVDIVH